MSGGQAPLFGDRLAAQVAARESQLVLGLDPDPARLWPGDGPAAGGIDRAATAADAAATAVVGHCRLVLDAAGDECVAVKLQLACFERLGAPGWGAVVDVAELARERGLLVIADAKRGDIGTTAAAYAQAFFGETETPWGPVAGLGADAMTVNPLFGIDSLEPLVDTAREHGCGLFVIVRSSNPGATDVQELVLAGGETVSDRIASIVADIGASGVGKEGLADVGAVVGATAPERIAGLRERMPRTPFLLPGVGAQGGAVEDLAAVFAAGRASGLVTASRGIVEAHRHDGGDPAVAARAAARRLRELVWALAG